MLGVWIDPVTAQVMIALLRFMGALHSSDENQFLPGILAGIETAERVGSGLDAVVDILVIDKAAVPDQGLEPGDRSRKIRSMVENHEPVPRQAPRKQIRKSVV